MRRIPYHAGAGAWGAQDRITPPALPTITDEVTVRSAAEFNNARRNNRRIVVSSGTAIASVGLQGYRDLEVVIRNGASIREVWLANNQRLYFHGELAGQHNSGRLDYIDAGYSGTVTDLIIDGLDSVPPSYNNCILNVSTNPLQRASITNMRIAGGIGLWDGGASDVVIAGNNMYNASGWWIWRIDAAGSYARLVMFQNYLVSVGQPVVRLHRPTKLWIGENTWVNSTQFASNATGFLLRMLNSHGAAVWFVDGRVHVQGSMGAEFNPAGPGHVDYWRLDESNTIVSDVWSAADLPQPGPDDDWYVRPTVLRSAGNALPPWSHRNASGDPRPLRP